MRRHNALVAHKKAKDDKKRNKAEWDRLEKETSSARAERDNA